MASIPPRSDIHTYLACAPIYQWPGTQKAVKKKYGVEVDKKGRVQEYSILSCTWGSWMETLVALPADWSIQRRASGSLVCSSDAKGANVRVS